MESEHLTPAIGTLVHGIDLSSPDDLMRHEGALRALLDERQVIFFRGQSLTPTQQVRCAAIFGEPKKVSATFPAHPDSPYLEILKSVGKRTGTDVWHADLTWQKTPPAATCLYSVDVPAVGGDTMWSSMTAAFESLDESVKARIRGLEAVHNWEVPELTRHLLATPSGTATYLDMRARYQPVNQPLAYKHPRSGRELVFANALYTTHVCGVTRDESAALIDFLSGLARVPEWQVRFRWQPGSVAVWDNYATQHYAVNDYHPYPRLMHRVAID